MSDDLVNRLRREAGTLATMYDAADEIDNLRRLNSELTATHNKMVVWDARQADEIERLRAALKWQPIETALEGDLVLCWCPKAHRGLPSCEVLMVYYGGDPVHASGRSYWTNGGPNGGEDIDFAPGEEPTHWQPLPKEAP